jgi:probable metal-binding protein
VRAVGGVGGRDVVNRRSATSRDAGRRAVFYAAVIMSIATQNADIRIADSVHGHDVLALVKSAKVPLTPAELEARYHTCSAAGLTFGGLMAFLNEREKLVLRDGRLHLNAGKVCDHG